MGNFIEAPQSKTNCGCGKIDDSKKREKKIETRLVFHWTVLLKLLKVGLEEIYGSKQQKKKKITNHALFFTGQFYQSSSKPFSESLKFEKKTKNLSNSKFFFIKKGTI